MQSSDKQFGTDLAAYNEVSRSMMSWQGKQMAVGLDQVHAGGPQFRHHRLGDPLRRLGHRGQHIGRDDVDGRPVALGDGECMARIHRIDVHEGDGVVVLEELEAGNLARDDLAEDAIGVGRMAHRAFSRMAASSRRQYQANASSTPR